MNEVRLKELLDERETEVRRELTKHEDEVRRLEDRLARGWDGTGALEPELKRHYDALGLIETTFRLRLGAETRDESTKVRYAPQFRKPGGEFIDLYNGYGARELDQAIASVTEGWVATNGMRVVERTITERVVHEVAPVEES